MNSNKHSIVSQINNLQIRSSSRRNVIYHPQKESLYFEPIQASTEAEMEFNSTIYYRDESDLSFSNQLGVASMRSEIAHDPDNVIQYRSPFRVMVLANAPTVTQPAYIPVIDDMDAYLHRGVSVFMTWYCQQEDYVSPLLIPSDLVHVFDLKIIINTDEIPIFSLPLKIKEVILGANRVGVHVFKIKENLSHIRINVHSCITPFTDTRFYSLSIWSKKTVKSSSTRNFLRGSTVVFWNARSVHRPSFEENFGNLFRTFRPMLVIITEAKACRPFIHWVRQKLVGNYFVEVIGPEANIGGILVIWDNRAVPRFHHKQQTLYGHIMSTSISPGWIALDDLSSSQGLGKTVEDSDSDEYEYF